MSQVWMRTKRPWKETRAWEEDEASDMEGSGSDNADTVLSGDWAFNGWLGVVKWSDIPFTTHGDWLKESGVRI